MSTSSIASGCSQIQREEEGIFNAASFRAFKPDLDQWEQKIIQCVMEDNAEAFARSCYETSRFFQKSITVNDLQHLALYRARKFPNRIQNARVIHLVALLSAHRILQCILDDFPPTAIWTATQEGINAIHTAAAVGDYLALRMLLQRKDAPIGNVDKLKRTALHYAAETNIETVITLLTHSKDLLKCVDIDDLTPLQFIQHENRLSMYHFLEFHTELYNAGEGGGQSSNSGDKKAVNLRRLIEAPLLLDSYVCTFLPLRQDSICEKCNTRGYSHEKLSENAEFMKVIASRELGCVRRPTNTFGQFEKTFSPIVSQFMRITDNTSTEKLQILLFDLWQMPKPGLVLTFYGSDPLSPSLQQLLQKSLTRVTRQTRTWIVTDGREKCVGDVISKAVRGYAEAYGMQQLQVIGLVPWRRLYNSHLLRCDDYLGVTQMAFPKKPPGNDDKIQLAENHTHYIFIDSVDSSKDPTLCRTQFETYVGYLNDLRNEVNRIPVCGVLIEGDRSNLPGISSALKQNIPFIVISDTGGLAKALKIFVDFMKHLMQDENHELFEGIDEEDSWDYKVRIALSLNRTDFLPENMFSRVLWQDKKGMKEVLTKCLMENNANFIHLLVDSGFPLHEYIDESLLVKLYKADFASSNARRVELSICWLFEEMQGESKKGEESLLQLLIWSFLSRRFELSHLIWTLMKDSIPAALILAFIARRMRTQQQSLREANELEAMAEFYERSAVGILEECHLTDLQSTLTMLCMKRPLYGSLSQLLLAEGGHSLHFIEHQACQTCVETMWNQNLSATIQPLPYIMSLVAGVILPPLVPLLAEYDYSCYKHMKRRDDVQGSEMEKNDSKTTYKRRIVDFYRAPCVRFAYSAAIETHNSVRQYFRNTWNRLVLLSLFFYVSGNLHYLEPRIKGFDVLAGVSRLFLSSCLLCSCVLILHYLVLSRYIGPKLMMIITMVKCDMLPFLAIIGVFWLTFSLFTVAMIYKPHGPENMGEHLYEVLYVARNNFFSMFGEFDIADNVADIAAEGEECVRFGECIYPGARYIYPIVMMVYVLLTHVLLINLLIAMFTERYDKMEHMSKQLWAMQKFGLVKSFANAPPLPFPYVVIWPFVSAFRLCCRLFRHQPIDETPFCFEVDETRQGQIINWAKFRSLDYQHRHPNAFQRLKAQARYGKLHKKTWWSDIEGEEYQESQHTTICARLATELVENRLQAMEMRLSATASGAVNGDQKTTLGPKIVVLEEDGKVVSRSQSKLFDSIHMSKFTDSEADMEGVCGFTYDRHTLAYFHNPQDDIMPRSLTRFVPWTEELLNYEPKVLDCVERILPDWSKEEMEEGMSKWKAAGTVVRNPTGRTGIAGRGILPAFGANPAVVVVLILEQDLHSHETETKGEVLRRVLLRNCPQRKYQLPWFLCKHTRECNHLECMQSLLIAYMHAMVKEASKLNSNQALIYRLIVEDLNKCPVRLCHMGELEDWINSDNAWIDVTAISVRISSTFRFWEQIPQIFSTSTSKANWQEMSKLPSIKTSHFRCLAYFQEAFIRRQLQA
ncbi:Transient receptor potential cation channel subfamily M member 8 [Taenia crassiceps]|uniref:Transient receptor potential cation channel subfamily M member 8 n=1 Tax=Taenia crassiceps TaxID=6207 RepID=A0ABR4QP11_9CEST